MAAVRTILVVALCAVVGFVGQMLFAVHVLELDESGNSALPRGEELRWTLQLGIQVILGMLALALLPLALQHEPPDRHGEPSPGPRSALVAGVVAAGSGVASVLGFAAELVAMVSVFSRGSPRCSLAVVGAVIVGVVGDLLLEPGPVEEWGWLALTLFTILLPAALVGQVRLRRRRERSHMEAVASMTRDEMSARTARAIDEERRRIARDMHDSLSHRLSLVAVHAGVLEIRDDLPPHVVRQQASILREQAELGVADLRAVLTALREEPDAIDPRTSIDELVASARAAGDRVRCVRRPQVSAELLDALPAAAVHTLRRTVQEGLTNARKHAPGQLIDIDLTRDDTLIRLTMTNPLDPDRDVALTRGGMGLIGLQERARLAGGECNSRATQDAFVLTLELPWR